MPGAFAPISCQVTHGPGAAGLTAEPPATAGFSASSLVWMFSDGTGTAPAPRAAALAGEDPLALVGVTRVVKAAGEDVLLPKTAPVVSSYQVAHGTVRPAPAKSIAGASPS